jgi:hypothetical protein
MIKMKIISDQNRAGLNGLGGDPDIMDRYRFSGSFKRVFYLAKYLSGFDRGLENSNGRF